METATKAAAYDSTTGRGYRALAGVLQDAHGPGGQRAEPAPDLVAERHASENQQQRRHGQQRRLERADPEGTEGGGGDEKCEQAKHRALHRCVNGVIEPVEDRSGLHACRPRTPRALLGAARPPVHHVGGDPEEHAVEDHHGHARERGDAVAPAGLAAGDLRRVDADYVAESQDVSERNDDRQPVIDRLGENLDPVRHEEECRHEERAEQERQEEGDLASHDAPSAGSFPASDGMAMELLMKARARTAASRRGSCGRRRRRPGSRSRSPAGAA